MKHSNFVSDGVHAIPSVHVLSAECCCRCNKKEANSCMPDVIARISSTVISAGCFKVSSKSIVNRWNRSASCCDEHASFEVCVAGIWHQTCKQLFSDEWCNLHPQFQSLQPSEHALFDDFAHALNLHCRGSLLSTLAFACSQVHTSAVSWSVYTNSNDCGWRVESGSSQCCTNTL